MNDALFAIPGLMPPSAPNFHSKLIAPEDGSLRLCVHCGTPGDHVNYAIDVPGWRRGVIKDPSYNYGPVPPPVKKWLTGYLEDMPQFMTLSEVLPPHTIIPRMRFRGCPIPITERPDLAKPWYWIIDLPARTLPPGDTVVEVVINGRVRKYVVQRPYFAIHSWRDITWRFKHFSKQKGESLDVAFQEGSEHTIVISLHAKGLNPEQMKDTAYQATATFNGEVTELSVAPQGCNVLVTIPALTPGCGIWNVQYKQDDEWQVLSAGDLLIVPVAPGDNSIVTLEADTTGEFYVDLDSCCDTSDILEGAEYQAEIIINGDYIACSTYLKDENTLAVQVPATPEGEGIWTVQYKVLDDWLDLSAGTIKIIHK